MTASFTSGGDALVAQDATADAVDHGGHLVVEQADGPPVVGGGTLDQCGQLRLVPSTIPAKNSSACGR